MLHRLYCHHGTGEGRDGGGRFAMGEGLVISAHLGMSLLISLPSVLRLGLSDLLCSHFLGT
jgi:hypothetical protein